MLASAPMMRGLAASVRKALFPEMSPPSPGSLPASPASCARCGVRQRALPSLSARGAASAAIAYFAVDDCEQLARDGLAGDADNVVFQKLDIANSLIDGSIERAIEAPPVDMAVCFGFFHHIPGADSRAALLRRSSIACAPAARGGVALAVREESRACSKGGRNDGESSCGVWAARAR